MPKSIGKRSGNRGKVSDAITAKEARFCLEVVAGKEPYEAIAISHDWAHLSSGDRHAKANALLKKRRVRQRIKELQAPVIKTALAAAEVSFEKTFFENARIAFSDPRRLFDDVGNLRAIHELDDDTAAAISSFEVRIADDGARIAKVKLWDKGAAVERFMRHFGAYTNEIDQQAKSLIGALAAVGQIDSGQLMVIRERLASLVQPRLVEQSVATGDAGVTEEG